MNDPFGMERVLAGLRVVRARTWVLLGAAAVAVLGAGAWVVIATASWLFGQVPAVADLGKRLSGEAIAQVEQVTPGLGEELSRWLPDAGGAMARIEQMTQGSGGELARRLPEASGSEAATDVSGTDVGPVARYPGLVRSHFAREATAVEAKYTGAAAFASVLDHYVGGFVAAGFEQQVLSATPDVETHRLQRGAETVYLTLARQAGGWVELRLSERRS